MPPAANLLQVPNLRALECGIVDTEAQAVEPYLLTDMGYKLARKLKVSP